MSVKNAVEEILGPINKEIDRLTNELLDKRDLKSTKLVELNIMVPLVDIDEDEIILSWYGKKGKQVTLFIDINHATSINTTLIKSWGAHIHDDMEDIELTTENLRAALKWMVTDEM